MNTAKHQPFTALSEEDKSSLKELYANRHKELALCGEELKLTTSALKDRGWKTHQSIWNSALFLNTVCFDHSVIFIDFACEPDPWRQSMLARKLALLIFEIGEDLPSVFGSKFRAACSSLGVADTELSLVGSETKKICQFWSSNRKLLKDIRLVAAAHRDHDALALLETIESIDFLRLYELGLELGNMILKLGKVTQPIVMATARIQPPESKLGESPF